MFHIVLECEFPKSAGLQQAALDITEEFLNRPWHANVQCTWNGRALRLEADNDYDDKGLALLDEFSDAITACVKDADDAEDGDLRVISVTSL
ncbi:MAG TPA: hypothetical protein VLT36_02800 [Candidatus Dormibacteraeota bacterium]|nr:hypothetical protein [Candidatus Dormibacteraeota bacterium]